MRPSHYSKIPFLMAGIVVPGLIVLPLVGGEFIIYLVTTALIFAIFAMAYDLLYGYAGLVSFGHSVFYGVPAYALGAVSCTLFQCTNPLITLGTAILTGIILGIAIGFFCIFSRGIYLALITFAFAQIFWLVIMSDPFGLTLGENGIMQVRPPAMSVAGYTFNLFRGVGFYYLVLGLTLIAYFIIYAIVESPFGDVLKGIKHNEDRLMSLGYDTRPYKITAFGLSGMFSGLAGALTAFLSNGVVPSMVDWHVGAEILLITILGGAGTLIGPMIASFLVVFTESYASAWIGSGNWVYAMGGLYIGVVMFLPGGIFNSKYLKPGRG